MVQRLRLRLLPATARASHFHLRPGSAILQLVVPLVTVKADSPSDFPRLAREKGSRPVVAAVVFSARSSPEVARFVFYLLDLLFDVIVIVLGVLILRIEFERLVVVIKRVGPIAQLLIVAFLSFAVLIKSIAKVVMSLALQTGVRREQSLTERFQRLVVIF